jgi:hypothetical protein
LIELKYGLEGEVRAARVANGVLVKQLEENQQEMAEIRDSVHILENEDRTLSEIFYNTISSPNHGSISWSAAYSRGSA